MGKNQNPNARLAGRKKGLIAVLNLPIFSDSPPPKKGYCIMITAVNQRNNGRSAAKWGFTFKPFADGADLQIHQAR
ncbi:hypothetical protein IH992_31490, partial [Candidatus Poribacteria bacterium]|nr:hypothetical protein [Candidatus Poribacteria bacterium]